MSSINLAVNQSCLALQKDGAIREMENRMNQAAKQTTIQQQLLQHMIEQQDLEIYDLMLANEQGMFLFFFISSIFSVKSILQIL